jgi:hypothetical protein
MIDDDLRTHYAAIRVEPGASARILAVVTDPPLRQNRRAAFAISGSVAAVGALALAVALVSSGEGGADSAPAGSPGGVVTSAAPSSSLPSAIPTASPVQTVSPQLAVQTLVGLTSAKGIASLLGGRTVANTVAGEIVFDDGHGAAQMDVALTWKGTQPHDAVAQDCSASPTCTVLPDGTTIATAQGLEYPADPSHKDNSTEWTVTVYHPSDGLEVAISEWNAPTEKDSPVSRPTPPFSLAELTAIATSPSWSAMAGSVAAATGSVVPDVTPTESSAK